MDRKYRLERITEFLLVGVVLGVAEDILAVMLVTGGAFNIEMLGIVLMVALPFAVFSELIVDSDESRIIEKIAGRIKKIL